MRRLVLSLLALAVTGCLVPVHRTHREPVPFDLAERQRDTTLDHAVRVTRLDGRKIDYPIGSQLGNTGVWGRGRGDGRRGFTYNTPLDSIAHIEVRRKELLIVPTILATGVATAATVTAILAGFLSIWTN